MAAFAVPSIAISVIRLSATYPHCHFRQLVPLQLSRHTHFCVKHSSYLKKIIMINFNIIIIIAVFIIEIIVNYCILQETIAVMCPPLFQNSWNDV